MIGTGVDFLFFFLLIQVDFIIVFAIIATSQSARFKWSRKYNRINRYNSSFSFGENCMRITAKTRCYYR